MYQVIVGNIGEVYHGNNLKDALNHYREYISQSKENYGRASGEDVTLFLNNEIRYEFIGSLSDKEGN